MSGGGDTPQPNTFVKFEIGSNPLTYMAGLITNEDTQEYRKGQLLVYAQAGGAAIIGFNENGKWTGGTSTSDWPERFFNACEQEGYEITNYQIIQPDWQVGHEIENWSEYVEVES